MNTGWESVDCFGMIKGDSIGETMLYVAKRISWSMIISTYISEY